MNKAVGSLYQKYVMVLCFRCDEPFIAKLLSTGMDLLQYICTYNILFIDSAPAYSLKSLKNVNNRTSCICLDTKYTDFEIQINI